MTAFLDVYNGDRGDTIRPVMNAPMPRRGRILVLIHEVLGDGELLLQLQVNAGHLLRGDGTCLVRCSGLLGALAG